MNTKLNIGNLSNTTSTDDLRRLFAQAGEVALASVIKDHVTGLSTGAGLVMMATPADTRKAIGMFNAYRLNEQTLTVSRTRPRLVRTSGRPH
jgi:RNA recognition motif-containing protein